MKRYRLKDPEVEAQQWHKGDPPFEGLVNQHLWSDEPYVVKALPVGRDRVRDGYWVVTDVYNQISLVTAEKFEQRYELADAER